MKVAILAGGKGTRLGSEPIARPKPMVEIGGTPIIFHIMEHYSRHGFNDFVIALGYKADFIQRYFRQLPSAKILHQSAHGFLELSIKRPKHHLWRVTLVETGLETLTGGRIKRLAPYLGHQSFMLTWGDGLSDVDLHALQKFHQSHGKLATLTAVSPPIKFGHLVLDSQSQIREFREKQPVKDLWINGAYFVLEPKIFEYIEGDHTQWEHEPLSCLAREGQLMAYKHYGFWQCMDTLEEKKKLEEMWRCNVAKWKVSPQIKETIHESSGDWKSGVYRCDSKSDAAESRA